MDDSERDALLARLDERTAAIATATSELKKGMYGDDGQGGLCGRMTRIENQQSSWLGRDGAIVAGISIVISLLTCGIIQIGRP